MDTSLLPSLAFLAVAACFTPGPNNFLLMSSGAAFGWRKTVPHIFGVQFGFGALMAAAVFGLGITVTQFPWLVTFVKIIGAVWLCWMAFKFLKTAFQTTGETKVENAKSNARPFRFYEAALFQFANPKAVIMAISAAGAYITIAETPLFRAFIISAVFVIFGFMSSASWTVAGHTLNRYMSAGRSARMINAVMGLLLIATAAIILMAKSPA